MFVLAGLLALDVYSDLPSSVVGLCAAGLRKVFKTGVKLYHQQAALPTTAWVRLVRATLGRVLDQHGHVYTNESLLQNIGIR